MWTKEDMMKLPLPQEKLPEIGSDKTYNDVVQIEEDWEINDETKPQIHLLTTNIRNKAEEFWQTIEEAHLEAQLEKVNVTNDIVKKFLKKQ